MPRYADPANPRGSAVRVRTPDGAELDVTSEELRARLSGAAGEEVRLLQVGRGTFDSMPVSVITTTTEATLTAPSAVRSASAASGPTSSWRRLPPPRRETDWFNGTLVFGDGARADCASTGRSNAAPSSTSIRTTAAKDFSVLRMVAQKFNNEVGAYCTTDGRRHDRGRATGFASLAASAPSAGFSAALRSPS